MKKVLVTGINGLIGQYISEPLKELGFEVYGIGTRNIETDKLYYIKLNINNTTQLENKFKEIKPEYLIHLAWDTKQGYLDSDSNFDLLASSINMLKYFKENGGKRVIYTGTCFEYKFKDSKIKEYDELNPISIYTKCKNYLREVSELYCKKYDIDLCWCRIFYMYGKNEDQNRLFPYIINNLKNDKKVSINHSQLKKDYMFAGDVAKAIAFITDSDFKGSINICSGKAISLKDFALIIAKKMNKENLLELKELNTNEPNIIIGDNSKLINEIGFNKYSNINDILDQLILEYTK
ncbi:NAD-dependent epimerase/dehydratase family protein [Brachyspira murdochii]|uniref:NAD-dependent epimerase/dehydratase n=1 Tax=Brachyspira murdochii (strain ATCC 51284 / DSM 12563 / 56-150) TaxID=526224 RepID=D5U967_BRAM5|nr:NAD(P)-dependent oxidoreductase [Brachyspira murdochii]ADG71240.1 NAD-dependent epimerase/dehydratase [Brachyspira murdochii DSM 12563]